MSNARRGIPAIAGRVATVVASIGDDDFRPHLIELMSAAELDQCNVFTVDQSGAAQPLFIWNRFRPQLNAHRVRRYVDDGFAALDPVLCALRGAHDGARRMHYFRREDIRDERYRRLFFDEVELSGKISAFERGPFDQIYLNLYGRRAGSWSTSRQLDGLLSLADIVLNSIVKHREFDVRANRQDAEHRVELVRRLLSRSGPGLSSRELEVCARQVVGQTTEAIALDLRVAESSIATYRKRAYAKLGVRSQNDLFALCLSATGKLH